MANDATYFIVEEGGKPKARDAGSVLTAALPVTSVTPTGGTPGLLPDVLARFQPVAVLYLARDPTPADIPARTSRKVKNTVTGRVSDWMNDDGTMIDLLTLA